MVRNTSQWSGAKQRKGNGAKRFSDYELGERTTDSPIGKGGGGDVIGH